jgi:hypothetical protein
MIKATAIFCMLMGLAMFGSWTYLFITGGAPNASIERTYLLIAEFLTAAALVAGGWGVLAGQGWAMTVMLVALGELIYCTIRYAGELGQEGVLPGLVFFSIVGASAVVLAALLVTRASR